MKNKILEIVNSIAVLVLFLSLGMYDSENIVVPIIMSLTSICWILLVTIKKKEIKLAETGRVFLEEAEPTKNLEEMRTLYRLVYKNGDQGGIA